MTGRRQLLVNGAVIVLYLVSGGSESGAPAMYLQVGVHDAGDISVEVEGNGTLRNLHFPNVPAESSGFGQSNYLAWALPLFGCVRHLDTLVSGNSTGVSELFGQMTSVLSDDSTSPFFDPAARAEQEYRFEFADTFPGYGQDEIEGRLHQPIGVAVHAASYAWSRSYARRFVLVDAWVVNVSHDPIEQGCIGLSVAPSVTNAWLVRREQPQSPMMGGFIKTLPGLVAGMLDTVNMAWVADNDGCAPATSYRYGKDNPTAVLGIRFLRLPHGAHVNYNWWGDAWYPSRRSTIPESRVDSAFGHPVGDRNRYKRMTNGEIDYDQPYAGMDLTADGWNPPPPSPWDGIPPLRAFLLSCGPLPTIAAGDSVPFTYAVVMGADFHTNPHNYESNFRYDNPTPYLDRLDFSDLISNARWAEWVFDNPGVDTDGGSYRGKYHVVCTADGLSCDTVYYTGDGVPDFRGPRLPSGPAASFTTQPGVVTLRWNGALTEYAHDPVTRQTNWEGYRVYVSRTNIPQDFALVGSWDKEDFKRFSYREITNDWRQSSVPLSINEWQEELGDSQFDPRDFPRPSLALAYADTVVDTFLNVQGKIVDVVRHERLSYFTPEDANNENAYSDGGAREANRIQQIDSRDTVVSGKACTYGVYEFTLNNLLGSVPLYFSVTTVTWGDYAQSLGPSQSPVGDKPIFAFPLYSTDVVVDSELKVSVYPNPYKIRFKDAIGNWTSYYQQGYEGSGQAVMTERDRRIWFINLPDTATISIYSLDGDLVRRIHHPDQFLTVYPSVVGWDLVSRCTEAVTSGVYIWCVESRLGKQIGKLVIIK